MMFLGVFRFQPGFMDDLVIFAATRWKLRRAIRRMYDILGMLKLSLHPDKRAIG